MSDEAKPQRSADRETYRLLEELDRCEALLEDLDELGLATREDIERHMAALHERLDAIEAP